MFKDNELITYINKGKKYKNKVNELTLDERRYIYEVLTKLKEKDYEKVKIDIICDRENHIHQRREKFLNNLNYLIDELYLNYEPYLFSIYFKEYYYLIKEIYLKLISDYSFKGQDLSKYTEKEIFNRVKNFFKGLIFLELNNRNKNKLFSIIKIYNKIKYSFLLYKEMKVIDRLYLFDNLDKDELLNSISFELNLEKFIKNKFKLIDIWLNTHDTNEILNFLKEEDFTFIDIYYFSKSIHEINNDNCDYKIINIYDNQINFSHDLFSNVINNIFNNVSTLEFNNIDNAGNLYLIKDKYKLILNEFSDNISEEYHDLNINLILKDYSKRLLKYIFLLEKNKNDINFLLRKLNNVILFLKNHKELKILTAIKLSLKNKELDTYFLHSIDINDMKESIVNEEYIRLMSQRLMKEIL